MVCTKMATVLVWYIVRLETLKLIGFERGAAFAVIEATMNIVLLSRCEQGQLSHILFMSEP